jgi:hypothetical protein
MLPLMDKPAILYYMNTRSNKNLAILMTFAILLTIACNLVTLFPTPAATTEPKLLHFENEQVAFDYPDGWTIYTAGDPAFVTYPIQLSGELVAGVADPHTIYGGQFIARFFALFRQPLPPGANVEQVMQEAYSQVYLTEGVLSANGPVTLAGLPASQKTYRVYSGEPAFDMRDIWAERGNEIFRLSIWTNYGNPEFFAAFQSIADKFIESLEIK